MFWIVARTARGITAAIVIAACLIFVWRLNWSMASPWNAHIGVLPGLLFIVSTAAVASGHVRWWPAMVFSGSFAAQAHVGFVPLVISLTLVAVVVLFVPRTTRAAARGSLNGALWCVVILWALPLAEALAYQGGNALALWRFFVIEGAPPHAIRETFETGCFALMTMFRSDFELPWGGHFELHSLGWIIPAAVAEVVGLALLVRRQARRERTFEAWLAGCALLATAVGVASLSRVRGDILNHELLRLAAIGALNLGILAAGLWNAEEARTSLMQSRPLATRAASAIVLVFAAGLAARDVEAMTAFEIRRERERVRGVEAHVALRDYLDRQSLEKPLIVVGNDRYSEAAAVLLRLLQSGKPAAVDNAYVGMFSEAFRRTGNEDVTVVFADLEQHRILRERPETTMLFQAFPLFVDVTGGTAVP